MQFVLQITKLYKGLKTKLEGLTLAMSVMHHELKLTRLNWFYWIVPYMS